MRSRARRIAFCTEVRARSEALAKERLRPPSCVVRVSSSINWSSSARSREARSMSASRVGLVDVGLEVLEPPAHLAAGLLVEDGLVAALLGRAGELGRR